MSQYQVLRDQIATAPAASFWVAIAIAALLGTIALFFAAGALRRRFAITGTPTSLIRSAAQGYVEFEGHGELLDGEPIIAPLSQRHCTWFRYKIEQRRERVSGGRRESEWQVIEQGVSDALFQLVDSSGRCVVDPDGATVTPSVRRVWYGTSARPDGPNAPRFSFGQRYRFSEERMHSGDPLFAIGMFLTAGGAGAALPNAAEIRDLIRLWKVNQEELLRRFDRTRDGTIDATEWEAVRAAAIAEVTARSPATLAPAVDVLRASGDPGRPFVLAAMSQEDLIRRLGWQALGGLTVALAVAVGIFWAITLRP
ncbi:MAG: hypothetical protein IT494_03350 [Gammaproteobacteria bacterium]|nr:hypothetical protein [Gammaproteobacteria bacterium]